MKPGYFDHTPKVKVDDGNTIVLPVQAKSNSIYLFIKKNDVKKIHRQKKVGPKKKRQQSMSRDIT